ncbi:mediator of RNA polymerase II transcription subunit 15a isoform X6 [Arachis ipaensis]|uniref:mediator of RNA polymerase II transcription subunit 15a isoform X6 n=1 Tax=Arachis ipaensis TaxID=130454 RepID=UPI0007AF8BAB|nr:mediator of RNA polymerase II transcription subunit 15a isoform X6 [Arachis ipaensis]
MDTTTTSNWRDQLQPETRQIILNNIMGKLKFCHLPGDVDEDLERQKIAHSIEQKSYGGATTQADYFEKIASKILLLEKAREREWRYQLRPDCRQRIVNKIRETLRRHLRVSGPEGSQELWKIARRFEEKIFAAASSQTDYRRKIYLKVFTIMETMYQGSQEPANPGFGMQQFLVFTNNSNAMDSS